MYITNYTRLASIRPLVLSSSAYHHASGTVFAEGHRTSITLVSSPDHFEYLFNKGKIPLFTAENLPDGTRDASTHTDFPCWLTVAGTDFMRLAQKAKLDIDELFLTPEEFYELHEEPVIDQFKVPSCAADLADNQHLDYHAYPTRHQVPAIVPHQQNRGERAPHTHKRISNKYKQRITRQGPQRGSIGAPAASYTSTQFDQDVAALWG